jgi:hypothetical protein
MTSINDHPPRKGARVRRLTADDSFRWPKVVLGLAFLAFGSFWLWSAHSNALACANEACVVEQRHVLRAPRAFPFDARRPPTVVVERASLGRSGTGKRLLLRYADGSEVELARDRGAGVESQATRLRAHLANPRGSYSLEQPDQSFWVGVSVFLALFGLLMALDGLTLLGWRRLHLDGRSHVLTIDWLIFGLRVKRATFSVSSGTTLGRIPIAPNNPRQFWLALEDPGAPPRRLPLLDRPRSRAILEALLASS